MVLTFADKAWFELVRLFVPVGAITFGVPGSTTQSVHCCDHRSPLRSQQGPSVRDMRWYDAVMDDCCCRSVVVLVVCSVGGGYRGI